MAGIKDKIQAGQDVMGLRLTGPDGTIKDHRLVGNEGEVKLTNEFMITKEFGNSNEFSQWVEKEHSTSGVARMDIVATENFTDTAHGAQIVFSSTINGSNTLNQIATLSGNTATFTGTVNPTKGFIYTPLVYPASQTAITIDFSNNAVVRAQTTSGLTVTLSNFVAGKAIELWVTNTSGSTQSFTHGVTAINSTVGTTSYNMPGGSTVCARYVCLDGTLANTMCAVTHA